VIASKQSSLSTGLRSALLALAVTGTLFGAVAARAGAGASMAAANVPHAVLRADGVIRIRSTHDADETVGRLKSAVAAKGVRLFNVIDQAQLGKDAGLAIRPSTLVLFGNPPLGVQFLQSNPYSALDWPVRMLVAEDADGSVWLAWNDFSYIARRYHITNRASQFKMASEVAASIATEAAR
jgi:uncharacterized protein (DUF302 family)